MAYLSEKVKEDRGVNYKTGSDGVFTMYVGNRKVDVMEDHSREDGKVPVTGKLHEWLRAMKSGEDVDLHVPKTPAMMEPAARVAQLDDWGVRSSILYIGCMITGPSTIRGGFSPRPSSRWKIWKRGVGRRAGALPAAPA